MEHRLKKWTDEINRQDLTTALSDNAVAALSKAYVSMQNHYAAAAPEAGNGELRFCEDRLDTLYSICRRRCAAGRQPLRRSRMIPVLYDLLHAQMRGTDFRKLRVCENYMAGMISEWMDGRGAALEKDFPERDRQTELGILRMILDSVCDLPDSLWEISPAFGYYRRRLQEWADGLAAEGFWPGLSDAEALGRLDLLSRNSCRLSDNRYDSRIEKARTCYYARIAGQSSGVEDSDRATAENLLQLYEILMWGIAPDPAGSDNLAGLAMHRMTLTAPGSDERLQLLALCIDRSCMQFAESLQEKLLVRPA